MDRGGPQGGSGPGYPRFEAYPQDRPVLHFCGDDPQGEEDAAALAAHETGRQLFTVRVEDLPAVGPDLEQLTLLWQREALLLPGAMLIQCAPGGITASARHLAERLPGLVVLASREPVHLNRAFLRFDVDKPKPVEQKRWRAAASGSAGGHPAEEVGLTSQLLEEFTSG